MIFPHPESDLSLNIMVVAADVVRLLKKRNAFVLAESLMDEFLKKDKRRTPEMFINSVTFLFAFGYIEQSGYRLRLDESAATRRPAQLSLDIPQNA